MLVSLSKMPNPLLLNLSGLQRRKQKDSYPTVTQINKVLCSFFFL